MTLNDGKVGGKYVVADAKLPIQLQKRMEALGLTIGTIVTVMHKKRSGTAVILLRGTRFAVGRGITSKIMVGEVCQ